MEKIIIKVLLIIALINFTSCTDKSSQPTNPFKKDHSIGLIDFKDMELSEISHTSSVNLKLTGKVLGVSFDSSDPRPRIELTIPEELQDLTGYLYVSFDLKNSGDEEVFVTCRLNGEMIAAGANLIPAGNKGSVKTFVPHNKGLPEYISEAFSGMRGWPGKLVVRGGPTYPFDVRKIKRLVIEFPNPSTNHQIEISKIRAEPGVKIFTREELADNFFPIVDEFGQYVHEEWKGKIHSVNELIESANTEEADLLANPGPEEWNKFGGWVQGPQLDATGSFRTEKYRGKWWLVDPEGRLFWSHGIVGVLLNDPSLVTDKEHYFQSLPPREGHEPLYSEKKVISANDTVVEKTIVSFNYPVYNLERKYGDSWQEKYVDRSHRRLKSWGINTMGAWTSAIMTRDHKTPYTFILSSGGRRIEGSQGPWGKFPDPFDKGFNKALTDRLAMEKDKSVVDSFCLGYFIDNELAWGNDTYLAESTLKSPADQPAKIAFKEQLRQKYGSINGLNNQWNTKFKSWDAFLSDNNVPANSKSDLLEFNVEIARQYLSVCRKGIKEAAPDKLYLGARFDFHMYPYEDTTHNWLLKIAGDYCDVISFNRYRYTCTELVPPENIDKPVMIGEWHVGTLDRGMFHPGLRVAISLEQQEVLYKNFISQALKNPFIVGAHWFKYSDQPLTGRRDGENLRVGFIDICDWPYQELVKASRDMGNNMYKIRSEMNKP